MAYLPVEFNGTTILDERFAFGYTVGMFAGVFLVGKSQDEHMLSVHQNALFSRHRHNVHVDMTALPSPVNNHTDVAVLKATIERATSKSELVSGSDIEAFRPLRLEWHNLIPDNIQDFDTLVATEIEITKALIQFEEGRSGNHRGTRFTSYETWVEGKDF
eukprot:CAMPEP_0178778608 /NCGR_PEP_ID=MMETSP0745-20121128/1085_1 /TAXON_ID=913974 /ORGANISM="Nitzschia punctata, Strain CCMP561" /LENGTH=159 /DNA_ID=CAMNT_0020435749 /DNA_START=480 /DNA_END=958 /DNA_ORIENTATION=-